MKGREDEPKVTAFFRNFEGQKSVLNDIEHRCKHKGNFMLLCRIVSIMPISTEAIRLKINTLAFYPVLYTQNLDNFT